MAAAAMVGYCHDINTYAKGVFGQDCDAVASLGLCGEYGGAVAAACQVSCADEYESLLGADCSVATDLNLATETFFGMNCTTLAAMEEDYCEEDYVKGFCQQSCQLGKKKGYCEDLEPFAQGVFGQTCPNAAALGYCGGYGGAVAAACQVSCEAEYESMLGGDCSVAMDHDVAPETFWGMNCSALAVDPADPCTTDETTRGFCQATCQLGLEDGYCSDEEPYAQGVFGQTCPNAAALGFCGGYDGAVAAVCQVTCADEYESMLDGDCAIQQDHNGATMTFFGANCTTLIDADPSYCAESYVRAMCRASCPLKYEASQEPPSPPAPPLPPFPPPMSYCHSDLDEVAEMLASAGSCADYVTQFMHMMRDGEVYTPATNTAGAQRWVCDEDVLDENGNCMVHGMDGYLYQEDGSILMVQSSSSHLIAAGMEMTPAAKFYAMWVCQGSCAMSMEWRGQDCSKPNDYNSFISTFGEQFELGGTLCSQVKDKCDDATVLPGLEHTTKGQLVSTLCQISCGSAGVLLPPAMLGGGLAAPETCADGSMCDAGKHCMCAHRRKLLFGSVPGCYCMADDAM